MLSRQGYEYLGMDHFALPDDELVLARNNGTLQRNFQGYSTHAGLDLVGLGMTAISRVGDVYAQNSKTLDWYYAAVDSGHLPIERGYTMTADDGCGLISSAGSCATKSCHSMPWNVATRSRFASISPAN